jgi:flagellar M-ring protein FliF
LLAGMAVLLVLVLTVLRPLVRGLLATPRASYMPALPSAGADALGQGPSGSVPQLDYDGQIAQARGLVTQDPARVAQVVKTWVGNDE